MLTPLALLPVDRPILDVAAERLPALLRTLDAIHLATALRLADRLDAVIAYDRRMLDVAREAGLPTLAPA